MNDLSVAMRDELVIADLDTLRALSGRQRLRIMEAFARHGGEPRTVKDVARELGESPTKLYYHVNLLEQHGLLVVAESRIVSGILEKSYRPSARQFRVDRELLSGAGAAGANAMEVSEAIAQVVESGVEELRTALASGAVVPGDGRNLVSYGTLRLTHEQARRLRNALAEIVNTTETTDADADDYALTIAFHPVRRGD